ncbi:acyltransferase family protein [Pseudidiomarina sp. PP-1MA]|uniref:Acyltransferase family protein n=1 Tax=Pseudidiomarina sp. PP-1MA TaxID=3237706 RepID=A0AB39XCK5_9GAMM
MNEARKSPFTYRADIDGLRAIAVLFVILYHLDVAPFYAGYLGVDVFFVISGYLITRLLVAEIDQSKSISITAFYTRRARRLLPALFVVIIFTICVGIFVMTPLELLELAETALSSVFFSSNFYFWRTSDYFNPVSELNPLLHTWSLAIEEQYYVVYPVAFLLVSRYVISYRKQLLGVTIALSFALSIFAYDIYPLPNFYSLPTRFWELGVGALAALYSGVNSRIKWLPEFGLTLISFAVFCFNRDTPTPSYYTLLPVLGTICILIGGQSQSALTRGLSLPALTVIGAMSYSLYLWHQPVIAFHRIAIGPISSVFNYLLVISIIFLLAYGSYKLVEQPMRDSRRVKNKNFVGITIVLLSVILIVGILLIRTDGNRSNWLVSNSDKQDIFLAITRKNSGVPRNFEATCFFNIQKVEALPKKSALASCERKYGPGIVIIGDSHAFNIYRGLMALSAKEEIEPISPRFVVSFIRGGCRLIEAASDCPLNLAAKFLNENRDFFSGAIYHQAGFYFIRHNSSGMSHRAMFTRLSETDSVDITKYTLRTEMIEETMSELAALGNHVPVRFITPRIEPHISNRYLLDNGCNFSYSIRPGLFELFDSIAIAAHKVGGSYPSVELFNLPRFISMKESKDLIDCPQLMWRDGDHWSHFGEVYFVKKLVEGNAFDF